MSPVVLCVVGFKCH